MNTSVFSALIISGTTGNSGTTPIVGDWILKDGIWNNSGVWKNDAIWIN